MSPSPTPSSPVALPEEIRSRLVARLGSDDFELPLLPDTVSQILETCADENADARMLSDLIRRDQSLAGHVLRVSNSAAYAPKEPVVTLQHAVSRLGIKTVGEIAVAIAIEGRVFRVPGWQARTRQMWIHSAAAGTYAKEVARILRRNVEGAFLCGLLHDVGRPVILQALTHVVRELRMDRVSDDVAHSAMTEFHAELGARIATHFGLPDWTAEAIRFHHDPAAAGEHPTEARITRLADLLAHWSLDDSKGPEDFESENRVVEELNLYADDLMRLLELRRRVLEVAESFT